MEDKIAMERQQSRRSKKLSFRVLPEQKERLAAQAAQAGLEMSEYLRQKIQTAPRVMSKTQLEAARELHRLGSQLKKQFESLEQYGPNEEIFMHIQNTLQTINEAIRNVSLVHRPKIHCPMH